MEECADHMTTVVLVHQFVVATPSRSQSCVVRHSSSRYGSARHSKHGSGEEGRKCHSVRKKYSERQQPNIYSKQYCRGSRTPTVVGFEIKEKQ